MPIGLIDQIRRAHLRRHPNRPQIRPRTIRSGRLCKDLSASGLLQGARASKPSFLYEPRREIDTYQRLLTEAPLGTATCYGAVADQDATRYWLFLEKLAGRELYQIGDLDTWVAVAGWLADLHCCRALQVHSVRRRNPHLLSFHGDFYRRWLDRARSFAQQAGRVEEQRVLEVVGKGLEVALSHLKDLPSCFVHGEFYASNVLVDEKLSGRRICPVDWEMAGVGPGLLDLAALCTGWRDAPRRAIADGYYQACASAADWYANEEQFLLLLKCCELCLAVQWLGWAPHWVAPAEHARNWLVEASQSAETILA